MKKIILLIISCLILWRNSWKSCDPRRGRGLFPDTNVLFHSKKALIVRKGVYL